MSAALLCTCTWMVVGAAIVTGIITSIAAVFAVALVRSNSK